MELAKSSKFGVPPASLSGSLIRRMPDEAPTDKYERGGQDCRGWGSLSFNQHPDDKMKRRTKFGDMLDGGCHEGPNLPAVERLHMAEGDGASWHHLDPGGNSKYALTAAFKWATSPRSSTGL